MKKTDHGNEGAADPRRLPSILDIAPLNGRCPDETWTVKVFHGLNLEQAEALLRENPLHYLEAFYYMGPVAFAFYAPAIRTVIVEGGRGLGEPDGGEWDSVISVVELRMRDGLLPTESVPVMLDCLKHLAAQLPGMEYYEGEYAKMARQLAQAVALLEQVL